MMSISKVIAFPMCAVAVIDKFATDLSQLVGVPDDSTRFAICLFVAVPLSFIYGIALKRADVSAYARECVTLVLGLGILWFCFAWSSLFVILQPAILYLVMMLCHPRVVHKVVFFGAMGYLSVIHIKRMIATYNHDGYAVEISAPVMVMTIRITYVSSYISDEWGRLHGQGGSAAASWFAHVPKPLDYFSYMFHFPSVLAGPPSNFKDFIQFVYGKQVSSSTDTSASEVPSAKGIALKKLMQSAFFVILFLLFSRHYKEDVLVQSDFMAYYSVPSKVLYAYMICTIVKLRYYFVFLITDASNNLCGLGFNGYDDHGSPKWNRISNINIPGYEFALNFKELLDSWNISAALWLRTIVYERSSWMPLLATHLTSAVWHGFYPGYYLSFLSLGLVTPAARVARRYLRPHVLHSKELKILYDLSGWFATQIVLVYLITPFVLLDLRRGLLFWHSLYYFGHISCLLLLIIAPLLPAKKLDTSQALLENSFLATKNQNGLDCDHAYNSSKEKVS